MTYGTSSYGTSSYGGVEADLAIERLYPIAANQLWVKFTKEPQNINAYTEGDVLNPRTWKMYRDDTGVGFTVLNIEKINETIWLVTTLERFGTDKIDHILSLATLKDKGGGWFDSPYTFTFKGIVVSNESTNVRRAEKRRYAVADLDAPQAPSGLNTIGGVYTIKHGDYALHQGESMVEKLIIRRIMTPRGAFSAIGLVNYGLGIRVKEPLPVADIVKFQQAAKLEARQEPEVEDISIVVEQDQNAFTIFIAAKLTSQSKPVSFSVPIPFVNL